MTVLARRARTATAFLVTVVATCGAAAEQDLCAYGSGDPAIAACTRAIESGRFKGHDLAVRYSNRGVEWRLKQDDARALEDYGRAIRVDPRYADAYYNRCIIRNRRQEYDLAVADCSKAIALGPGKNTLNATGEVKLTDDRSRSDYFAQRGVAYHGKQDIDRAIADYSEALRLYPMSLTALNSRAKAYEAKGDKDRAKADADAAKLLAR
jgi:tetratricopeptide (TPR) repeat protein